MRIVSSSAQTSRPVRRKLTLSVLAAGIVWSNACHAQDIVDLGSAEPLATSKIIFVRSTGEQPLVYADTKMAVESPSVTYKCESKLPNHGNWQVFKSNYVPVPAVGASNLSKSAAILGGQLSKLDQIRLQQHADLTKDAAPGNYVPTASSTTPIPNCKQSIQTNNFGIMPAPADNGFLPEGSLFGTEMVPIGRTPFDRDWSRVSKAGSASKFNRALASSGVSTDHTDLEKMALVNSWVNKSIQYREDAAIYSKADYWATAKETLARKAGDCEDYAIVKMELLLAAGFEKNQMRLVIARDLVRNADHALLVVTLSSGAFVLDNATNSLLDARLANDYRPIMSFSGGRKWLHGYAMTQPAVTPPIKIAMLSVPSTPLTLP